MTLSELQAKRDELLGALAGPKHVQHSDGTSSRTMENHDPAAIREAIAAIDAEIAKVQGPGDRLFTIQTKRGLEE